MQLAMPTTFSLATIVEEVLKTTVLDPMQEEQIDCLLLHRDYSPEDMAQLDRLLDALMEGSIHISSERLRQALQWTP